MTVCKLPSLLHMRAAAIMEVSGVNEEYKTGTDRYKALFSQTNNMILYFDADGTVCEKNDAVCRNLGCDMDETICIQDIFRTCMTVKDGCIDLIGHKYGVSFETVAYRKNQTCFSVVAYLARLPENTGCYGFCIIHDIVQQKEAKKELRTAQIEVEESHKERNEMVANVTHELRTPVNGVLGLAQNLLDTELDSEQRENVELIEQCCRNMIKIINNILDFSKLQAGKFTIEYTEFDFYRMMDNVVKLNRPQAESKGLKLICNVGEDIPEVLIGDELRVTQVLNNLLSNSIKFTSLGQINLNVVKSVETGEEIELFFMVTDTGIGISEQEKDKLFKSFSQVDASITRKFGGTGLGLRIVKSLVEMMGGDINVESEKGKGSTFSFSIKVKKVVLQESENSIGNNANETEKKEYSFNYGDALSAEPEETENKLYKLGSDENMKAITDTCEKLVLCIEMENWNKANGFADTIKTLVADDPMNLKRKAFRLQMTVRKGDHEAALNDYNVLKEAIEEFRLQLERR